MGDLIQTVQSMGQPRNDIDFFLVSAESISLPLKNLLDEFFVKTFYINEPLRLRLEDYNNFENLDTDLTLILDSINLQEINALINLSWSKSATILSSLITSPIKLGLVFDSQFNISSYDDWSKFVFTNVLNTKLSPFSLVDIYKNIIGTSPLTPIKKQEDFNKESFNIILHPFSSSERKVWDIGKWKEVIKNILSDNPSSNITIIGSLAEKEKAYEIYSFKDTQIYKKRLNVLISNDSIDDIQKIIKEADLFVGHDSMVGHLSSLNNVQCLTISLGTVRYNETTPYGDGNYNILPKSKCFPCFPNSDCNDLKCHLDISPKLVSSSIACLIEDSFISERNLLKKISPFHLGSIEIKETFFTDLGFLATKDILNNDPSLEEIFKVFYRIMWLYFFKEKEEKVSFPKISKKYLTELEENLIGLQYIYELSEHAKNYSNYIINETSNPNPSIEVLKTNSERLEEIDLSMEKLKTEYPFLYPIIQYSIFERASLQGQELQEIANNAFLSYQNCSLCSSVLHELISKSLEHLKSNKKRYEKNHSA
tara:strand:- start:197 stop:1813 length:1617 start_codon:yes stop_codon:yes gene_type:complete